MKQDVCDVYDDVYDDVDDDDVVHSYEIIYGVSSIEDNIYLKV